MILHQVKDHLGHSEPITNEFLSLMNGSFRFYDETRSFFFGKLPRHLLQSELTSLVNVELKKLLFDENFCGQIQQSLRTLRRAIIRLEDLREGHPDHPDTVNDLTQLSRVAEQVEALYQKHWEYYRYQGRLGEADLVSFLLEIDRVGYAWDIYLSGFSAVHGVLGTLGGQPCPPEMTPLRVAYQRSGQHHFAVGSLRSLINFLEAGYRFVCATAEMDCVENPLTLLQVDISNPVEVHLAVPIGVAPSYRRFLQHLFLKDMLKRDALLKVVFEEVRREIGREKPLTPAVLTAFQKELTAELKKLPEDGRFTIQDLTFPDDGIRVLQEFTSSLDEKRIRYDSLIRRESAKTTKQADSTSKGISDKSPAPSPQSQNNPPASPAQQGVTTKNSGPATPATSSLGSPAPLLHPLGDKEHIGVLTDRRRNR